MSMNNTAQLKTLLLASGETTGQFLSAHEVEQLVRYYELVLKWNPQLHLTTIIEPAEFFRRHIFEAVFLTRRIAPEITEVWDLGAGLGIPGVPLSILRPDLRVTLVEANRRKAVFLDEVAYRLGCQNLAVIRQRFEALPELPKFAAISARAVEKMEALLPKIIEFGKSCHQILLLSGEGLLEPVGRLAAGFETDTCLIPGSQASFLINLHRST